MARSPNPYSPEEVRRAIQRSNKNNDNNSGNISIINTEITVIEGDIATIEGDVSTIEGDVSDLTDIVDGLAAAGVNTAVVDITTLAGQPLYVKSNGHVAIANANLTGANNVVGVATIPQSATFIIKYISNGKITLTDWTLIAGSASLSPGYNYFLAEAVITGIAPSYANVGGTGDRRSVITLTHTAAFTDTGSLMLDGSYSNTGWWHEEDITGKVFLFDLSSSTHKVITEATWYQDNSSTHGTWRWQGSALGVLWTNIGNTFTLGGTAQVQTELSGNLTAYTYYRLLGVSGSSSPSPYLREIEFKIGDVVGLTGVGMITSTAPTTAGSYLVRVGRAVSANILDIEIEPCILL